MGPILRGSIYRYIVFSLFIIMYLKFIFKFFDFTLDDAYIIYRYAKHLAQGHGLVWNVGEDPVEGYTSFLWVVLNACAIKFNVDPVLFSKVFSILSGLAILMMINRNIDQNLKFVFLSAVALNPAFVVITVQGMETTFAALLVVIMIHLYLKTIDSNLGTYVYLISILSFILFLIRPESIVFSIILFTISFINKLSKKSSKHKQILVLSLFSIPLIIYMIWRVKYFGYVFPNTFYIKKSEGLLSLGGMYYVFEFITNMLIPYLIIYVLAIKEIKDENSEAFRIQLPLVVSLSAYGTIYLFIQPIQGFLFRFLMPVFVGFMYIFTKIKYSKLNIDKLHLNYNTLLFKMLLIAIIIVLLFYPLHLFDDAEKEVRMRTQYDRVIVGKTLSVYASENLTMFVTESGALPFYSEWRALDHLGLNSEYIAHYGLSVDYLNRLNPDLIMVLIYGGEDFQNKYPTVSKYIAENNYILATVILKTEEPPQYHLYFVKNNDKGKQIIKTLSDIKGVKKINVSGITGCIFGINHFSVRSANT